jgi:trigger factor
MNVEFNKLDNVNGVITIVAQEQDFKANIEKQIKQLCKTREFPGFRAGHAPKSMVIKKYGQAVRYDVIDKTISEELFNFIKKEELKVLGQPVADSENLPNLDAEEMVFKFKVGLAPEIEVSVDDTLNIPYYKIAVSDEMIDRQSEGFRRRFGKQEKGETVEPEAIVKGTLSELNEDGSIKEDGLKVEGAIVSPQYFKNDEQKALFADKNVGAAVVFNPAATCDSNAAELSSMLHITKEEVDAHKGNFQMDIAEILVLRTAELNQEYFDNLFGADKVHNEEEYRAELKNMIAAQLTNDQNYRFSIDARDALLARAGEFELPDAILKEYLMNQSESVNAENVDEEYAKAVPGLKWQLVSDVVARNLEVKLSQEDVKEVAKMVARNQFAQYGMANVPEDVVERYADDILKDKKAGENLVSQALEMKLFAAVREKAHVEEEEVSVEDFNKLFSAEA